MVNTAPGVNAGEKVKVQSTIQSTKQVNSQSSIDNSQSKSASNPLPPTINNPPSTINKQGFLPRLGPKQLIALLAIVAIFLVIGFFMIGKSSKVTKTPGLEQKPSETANILSLLSDVKYATSEADSKDFYNVIKYSVENNTDDYWSAAVNILFACQEKVKIPEEKAKLKEAFDEIIKHVPKEKLEATASPYIWYCP